ncbi:MAG: hypothetical protein R2784_10820 [Saprospiraceae bacterium]
MKNLLVIITMFFTMTAMAQTNQESEVLHKYRLSVPIIIVPQLFTDSWNDRKHTQHIELHFKRNLDNKNIIGLKFATWRLFQPMGIVWWDGLLDKLDTGSEFYPGHVRETGLGVSYQRMLWKGLLPRQKSYLNSKPI